MDRQQTLQQLEAKLRENPNALVFARLADLYLQEKRFDEAINLCLKGLKAHSGYITGNFILGKAYRAKGDFEKAESEFKKVLTYDRTFLAAHKTLGDLMAQMGWENKAMIHYRDLLSSDPLEEDVRQAIETMAPAETAFGGAEADTGERPWTEELEEVFRTEPEETSAGAKPPRTEFTDDPVMDLDFESITPPDSSVEQESSGFEIQDSTDDSTDSVSDPHRAGTPDEPDLTPDIENLPDQEEEPLFDFHGPAEEPESGLSGPVSPPESGDDRLFDFENELFSSTPDAEEDRSVKPPVSEKEEAPEQEAWENLTGEEDVQKEMTEEKTPSRDPHLENEIIETIQELGENLSDSETPAESAPAENPPSESAEPPAKLSSQKKIVSTTLGEIFAAQGQFDKALEVYETLLASDPQNKRFQDKIAELKRKIREAGL